MPEEVERTLVYFSKEDESLVGECPLEGVALDDLQALFGVPRDDPMFEVFPVGPEQAEFLRRHVPTPIDLARYDYFVDCHARS